MDPTTMEATFEQAIALVTRFGLQVIGAIAILVIGRFASQLARRLVSRALENAQVDRTVVAFASSLTRWSVLAMSVIAALAKFGIQTASFVAILGSAGLAVGLAFQGSLSNFAAGVMLLLFRPFRIGNFVRIAGASGTVHEIGIFSTELHTSDNQRVIIPNSAVMAGTIVNVNALPTRRIDLSADVSYGDDLAKAQETLEQILARHPNVLESPAPLVRVGELGESAVHFIVRPWVKTSDYGATRFDLLRAIKDEFDRAGLSIPFPQRDVHVHQES